MVDEVFLQNAVRIRRTYLKLSNNMDLYQKKAQKVSDKLDETLARIEEIEKEAKESRNSKTSSNNTEYFLNELMKALQEVDDEGKSLENLVNPLNKEIEKLALEEQELYRKIKEKHFTLTDEQIIESVRDRLIKENLS
jgi:ABC-type Zn uptake system ZnuABC Zn-binding protein ZnuA